MIAGALGLVRKTAEQSWSRTRICLIGEVSTLVLGPWIFIFRRRVSIYSRPKDHGRNKLAFSVSGWRQVSARQKRVHSDSIMFRVYVANRSQVYGRAQCGLYLRRMKRSCGLVISFHLIRLRLGKLQAQLQNQTNSKRQPPTPCLKNRRLSRPEFGNVSTFFRLSQVCCQCSMLIGFES
jgi:hypothetical protein